MLTITLCSRQYYYPLLHEETEAQRGEVTSLRSHNVWQREHSNPLRSLHHSLPDGLCVTQPLWHWAGHTTSLERGHRLSFTLINHPPPSFQVCYRDYVCTFI